MHADVHGGSHCGCCSVSRQLLLPSLYLSCFSNLTIHTSQASLPVLFFSLALASVLVGGIHQCLIAHCPLDSLHHLFNHQFLLCIIGVFFPSDSSIFNRIHVLLRSDRHDPSDAKKRWQAGGVFWVLTFHRFLDGCSKMRYRGMQTQTISIFLVFSYSAFPLIIYIPLPV